ncbi:hypothetical protein ABW19_dt0203090 [Dactylella cylindrospora]|nr:hypothetical protein ABW19_dt0203090 [Dactylella cylindrospora]
MACYLVPPTDHPTVDDPQIPPSVSLLNGQQNGYSNGTSNGVAHRKNPIILPLTTLKKFHFAFLIRNPRRSIPSYYRCCIPPLSEMTGFKYFMPNEAGYRELRILFDYLLSEGVIKAPGDSKSNGTNGVNGYSNGYSNGVAGGKAYEVCVVDADDLLDHPKEVVEKFCEMVGLSFDENMLEWGANEGCESFEKWKGFHEDAIGSAGLKPRLAKKVKTREQEIQEWTEKYGKEAAEIIDRTADENMEDYEYLKQFTIKI